MDIVEYNIIVASSFCVFYFDYFPPINQTVYLFRKKNRGGL